MFTFAHYWGIDEVGVFVVPAVLAIVALRWAERKAKKAAAAAGETEPKPDAEEEIDVE
jgi:mannose/fructose/N-acetylgalactosamine-specific phosphotransferase system component IIC